VNSKRLVVFVCACSTALMLWPSDAAAQRRVARRAPVRTAIVVRGGYYRPYYYSPFLFSGFYDPFYAGWYPPYAQYPARYPGYYYGRSWASARLEVKPRDAQVYLDGYFVGVVDQFDGVLQRLDIPAGEHELSVYLPGYRSYRERTLFRPGQTYHFRAVLEPLAAGAPAEPKPEPQPGGAGQEPYRRDPYSPPPQQPGERGRTMPPPDRPGDRRGNREERSGFGTLNVRIQPADAVVIIDGERWDSPEGGSRLVVELAGGSHRIEVTKDGFKPYTTTIQIRPGESQQLNISLPRQEE
jgi:hypothetical protein